MTDAEQTLLSVLDKELDKRGYKPRDVKVKAISSGGANYTSKLFLVDVTTPNDDLKLFAKVAIIDKQMREKMSGDWLFATERLVYTKIAKYFDDIQKKHNISEDTILKFPKFYGCSDEYGKETVIMENLVASGYKPFNRFKSIDWEHASASVEYLAKFHALSFTLAKECPKQFEELSNLKYEIGSQEVDEEAMKTVWEKIVGGAIAVVKDEQKGPLMKFFQNPPKFNSFNKPIGTPVLSHGDFRPSNLLFKEEDDVYAYIEEKREYIPSYEQAIMTNAEQILRNILYKALDECRIIPSDVKIKPISSGGANYTSNLFLVDVKTSKEELNLFAKVANEVSVIREATADWLFDTERLVYTKVAKLYDELQADIPDEDKLKFPKFYGCSDEHLKETIILENLVASGYKSFDRHKSLDWKHASASVEYLAKFHALFYAFAYEYPKEYDKLSQLKYEIGNQKVDEAAMKDLWTKVMKNILEIIEEDQKERVLKYFESIPSMNEYSKPIGKPVLCHGDFRPSNIMYKNSGDEVQAIAVDFQTVYAGCPATDLIYLIFLGSDEEFRAEYYEKLLDHYYNSLCNMMQRLSVDPTEVYPREKFDSDIQQNLPYALLIGATILPTVVVEEDAAPDLENFDYNQFIMSPTELFAKRFRGIVNDCIRWKVI